MSMPLSPTRLFVCTACGGVLPVGEEHLGKKCRCGRCGKINNVVAEDAPRRAKTSHDSAQPLYFFCRVCDTRLAAQVKHVGRKAKCPDCGALTKVPPAPKPSPLPKKPRAMHGQQYGLWGVDDAPSPAEIAAKQPKYFAVWCRVCDTLMHARPEQVGKQLICPDCGAKTDVKEPPKPKPKKSPLVPDGQEYQLDAKQTPPLRPEVQFTHAPSFTSSIDKGSIDKGSLDKGSVDKKSMKELPPIRQERTDRPKIPSMPILQGVALMLVRSPILSWFCWISTVALIAGAFMVVATSLNPIAAIPCFIGASITTVLGSIALSAICLAVLTESSEGNDRLYNPPGPVFLDWMGDVFYLVMPAVLALAPWWVLCRVLEQELTFASQGIVMLVGWLFTFPLLLLSSLENGSPLEPFSARIFGSVSRRPGHWLLLVAETSALAVGALTAIEALSASSATVALLMIPLCVAIALLYFRILGRFAWWLAESLATTEE